MDKTPKIREAANLLGGLSETARLLDGVKSYQTVQQWIKEGAVPAQYCKRIEMLTHGKVTCKDLRPDDWNLYWPELAVAA